MGADPCSFLWLQQFVWQLKIELLSYGFRFRIRLNLVELIQVFFLVVLELRSHLHNAYIHISMYFCLRYGMSRVVRSHACLTILLLSRHLLGLALVMTGVVSCSCGSSRDGSRHTLSLNSSLVLPTIFSLSLVALTPACHSHDGCYSRQPSIAPPRPGIFCSVGDQVSTTGLSLSSCIVT